MANLKLKIYKRNGSFDLEEKFSSIEDLTERYNLIILNNPSLPKPTAWEFTPDGWQRIIGY